jgi:GntR family transcriptional regulator, rspAB operon transcriptional repressor
VAVRASGADAEDGFELADVRLVRATPMREQIYAILRSLILTGKLPPGGAVDEKAIAARLGVSRTPVREALMRLSNEGLVEVRAQSGTLVSRMSRNQIREAFLIRRALETECVAEAASRMTPASRNRLEDVFMLQQAAIERRSFVEAIGFDDAFHHMISDIAELPSLWHAIEVSKAPLDRCRYLTLPLAGKAAETLAQHRAIIDALGSGSRGQARRAMKFHLEQAYAGIVAFLAGSGIP